MRAGGWQLALGANLPGAQPEVAARIVVWFAGRAYREATPMLDPARIVSSGDERKSPSGAGSFR